MDSVKIYIDGIQKDVYGVFYIYNSKYYFIYTEKEVDENGYVILYMTQVGKETKNTPNGPVDTGYMVGVEVVDAEEQKKAQASVSYIVEDKKNGTTNPEIQYLPINMLVNLKIGSKKRFRLLKSIMMENFKLTFEDLSTNIVQNVLPEQNLVQIAPVMPEVAPTVEAIAPVMSEVAPTVEAIAPVMPEVAPTVEAIAPVMPEIAPITTETNINDTNVIIDYRSKYFEEEEKNQQLQAKIDELTQKLNEIKKVIE